MEIINQRREMEMQLKHIQRIKTMNAFVDTSTPNSLGLKHLATRQKKQQIEDDRRQAIARENKKLMENMAKILSESRIDCKPSPVSTSLKSINEAQRKSAVERLNFENRLLYNRLQSIGPMIKRESFQKDYEKNKAFHGRRRKHVPFGVAGAASRKNSNVNIPSSGGSHVENETADMDPESDSFLSQYRSMNNIVGSGSMGVDEGGNSIITNSDMPQSISEFRRQVISKKKLQNSGGVTLKKPNTLTPLNADDRDNGETKSKFILTHDPENT